MDQVGADSYASKLTLAAKKDAGPGKSEMMRSLDHLIRFIGIVLIPSAWPCSTTSSWARSWGCGSLWSPRWRP